MSSVCSHMNKLLAMGLIMAGGLSGVSYAASVHHNVKVQASFQQASRLGTLNSNNFASQRYGSVLNTLSQYVPSSQQPVANSASAETRRFVQTGRYVARARTAPAPRGRIDPAERVIQVGSNQIGKKYRWGGESPLSGFDCSGLVQYSMKTGAGVVLPRTAADQYAISTKVPSNRAMRGDLVFFNTSKHRRISHVGIYLGSNKFLHAPRAGKRIERAEIKGYWRNRLIGFGRIPGACKIPAYYG